MPLRGGIFVLPACLVNCLLFFAIRDATGRSGRARKLTRPYTFVYLGHDLDAAAVPGSSAEPATKAWLHRGSPSALISLQASETIIKLVQVATFAKRG